MSVPASSTEWYLQPKEGYTALSDDDAQWLCDIESDIEDVNTDIRATTKDPEAHAKAWELRQFQLRELFKKCNQLTRNKTTFRVPDSLVSQMEESIFLVEGTECGEAFTWSRMSSKKDGLGYWRVYYDNSKSSKKRAKKSSG
jgi:hypothetical protein